nr:hypothetical protein [Tanacetum cinerariifolium]
MFDKGNNRPDSIDGSCHSLPICMTKGFRKGIKGYKQSKKKRNQSIEEIVDRKLVLRDAEKDEKRDTERDAARDAEIEVESESVEREACNEGRLQKRRKQSSCESTTIVHQEQLKDIKVPKLCMLFSAYTEDSTPIARGMVYSIGDGTIHGEPFIPYYMKVSVDTFVAAFGDTKLPISSKADDTITMSKQSVGSFLQWPRCRISRILDNTLTLKDTSQRATLQLTLPTHIPVAQETTPLKSALETPTLLEIQQTEAPIAAYVRWTACDDDIADHIFEVPGGRLLGMKINFMFQFLPRT